MPQTETVERRVVQMRREERALLVFLAADRVPDTIQTYSERKTNDVPCDFIFIDEET